MFPTQISQASLKYYLFNIIDENDMLISIYNHLPEREAELFQKFYEESSADCQACMDILNRVSNFREAY